MSEAYKEHYPLLHEDLSDEEQLTSHSQFPKRVRQMVFRSRARNSAKGALTIIQRWPDHWSSSFTYWWITLGMFSIITLVVYNFVATFALPADNIGTLRIKNTIKSSSDVINESNLTTNVFMHIFMDNNQEIDLNKFVSHVDTLAEKFPGFLFHIFVLKNDTTIDHNLLSAEENNEIAFNILWTPKDLHRGSESNIIITHTTLSRFMENSPLRKYWRHLPSKFVEFLTRAVSVWEKGGVTFNPLILIPNSSYAVYKERLLNILKRHQDQSTSSLPQNLKIKKIHARIKQKVNNIQDIIKALEGTDEEQSTSSEQYPIAAENKLDIIVSKQETQVPVDMISVQKNEMYHGKEKKYDIGLQHETLAHPVNSESLHSKYQSAPVETSKEYNSSNGYFNILPAFINFLFNTHTEGSSISMHEKEIRTVSRKRKHILKDMIEKKNTIQQKSVLQLDSNLEPLVVSTHTTKPNFTSKIELNENVTEVVNQITIDLKGNIIASIIPCHAFLGTLFSDSLHHSKETVTDFIITELSGFCKGVLSSCNGIDIILL